MGIVDLIILAAVAVAVFFAVRSVRRRRKNGCSCGCDGCSGCGKQR